MYKIKVTDDCTGCELCVSTCDNFKMENDKAIPVSPEVAEIGCNQEAADMCPVEAIKVEEV
jgi:ferredoxin